MTQYTLEDFLRMNAQLTTRLRHLRLSGMVDALPGAFAQAEAAPLRHLEFSNACGGTSSPDAPIDSSRAVQTGPVSPW